jgi:NACalpha-BTF3-like transcription factor
MLEGNIFFLNNDTLVTDNWIDSSIDLLKNNSSIGLVGSKLIYPNGVLQEAGGIIWSDGSGCNYGRGDDPQRATYNFVREVDYCSGAAILIKRALFLEIGKFDSRYSPAYYEDTDLAFAVRKKGLRVIYNPFSEVVHCEGVTAGTDLTQGVKSYQVKNQVSFVAKWKKELALQGAPYTYPLHLDATRYAKKRILVLDHQTPRPDHDSGSVDMFNLLKIMNGFGYQVTFIPILDRRYFPGYIENLQKIGIECICEGFGVDPDRFIQEMGGEFDVVVISRVTVAREYIDKVTAFCSNAKIIFNTVDLHYLREERQASIGNNSFIQESAIELKKVELDSIRRADITIVVSQVEADILKKKYQLPVSW